MEGFLICRLLKQLKVKSEINVFIIEIVKYLVCILSKLTFFFRIFAQFTTHFNVEFLFKLQVKYFFFSSSESHIFYTIITPHLPHSHTNTVCLALEHIPDGQEHLHKIDSLFFLFRSKLNKQMLPQYTAQHNTALNKSGKPANSFEASLSAA